MEGGEFRLGLEAEQDHSGTRLSPTPRPFVDLEQLQPPAARTGEELDVRQLCVEWETDNLAVEAAIRVKVIREVGDHVGVWRGRGNNRVRRVLRSTFEPVFRGSEGGASRRRASDSAATSLGERRLGARSRRRTPRCDTRECSRVSIRDDSALVLQLIAGRDSATLAPMHSARLTGWVASGALQRYVEGCADRLEALAGPGWRVISEEEVTPEMSRFFVEGPLGAAVVTVRFDVEGRLDGYGVDAEVRPDGIGGISVACPKERVAEIRAFYAELVADAPLGFGESGNDYRAPCWGDPGRPQQMHFDIVVGDVVVAGDLAIAKGATVLRSGTRRAVYADPIGHPFCLVFDERAALPGELGRVVVDCDDPNRLSGFYAALLGMKTSDEHDGLVEIAHDDRRGPTLAFQRVTPYNPPRWGDPSRPQQMHFDMFFDDARGACALAEALGATRLPPLGGSCPVYADPAGHPFCLCLPYE